MLKLEESVEIRTVGLKENVLVGHIEIRKVSLKENFLVRVKFSLKL